MLQINVNQSRNLLDIVLKKPPVNIFIGDCIDVLGITPTEEFIEEYENYIVKEEEKRAAELIIEQQKREALLKEKARKEQEEAANLEKIHRLASKKTDLTGDPVPTEEGKAPEKILPKIINEQDDERTKALKEKWNKFAIPS